LQTKVTILTVDRKYSLVIETNKENFKTQPLEKTEKQDIGNNNTKYS